MTFETLIGGLDFGEGPRWHDDKLWYSDFFRHQVRTVDLEANETVVVEIEDSPSGLGWLPDGTLLIVAMATRQVLRLDDDGSTSVHADLSDFTESNCNDMVVDADGHAWVGNFGFDLHGGAEPAMARLAHVAPDGTVSEAADELAFPNGAVITPDRATLIVGETFGFRYTAFTIGADKTLSDRRVWASAGNALPDGCTLDADGGIWLADAGGSRCLRLTEGGEVTDEIATHQPVFACMLGGPDGRTLFALTAADSHPDKAAGSGTGTIDIATVDVPHAGRP